MITALNEKGIPTPLAATYMRAPMTRMDILTEPEVRSLVRSSDLVPVYEETIAVSYTHLTLPTTPYV